MADRTIPVHRRQRMAGTLPLPGDKSITHRILILGSLARGTTFVRNVPEGDDIASTVTCLKQLGVECDRVGDAASVVGLDQARYRQPAEPLDCGGSATTMRLLMGAVAARGRQATFTGDESLRRRPMQRVVDPLRAMGAEIRYLEEPNRAPLFLKSPDRLHAVEYEVPVPSAQVKTALIIAGLYAQGRTVLTGRLNSRDHTERYLPRVGGALVTTPDRIVVEESRLDAVATTVPGDPSTAAFFATAATLLPNSAITIPGMATNPTRTGFFEALSWMGGDIAYDDPTEDAREPSATVTVRSAPLKGIEIHAEAIPFLVDEVPLIMLMACYASGDTVLWGTHELRLKESDRIGCVVEGLTRMGAEITVAEDHVRIRGGRPLKGSTLDPWGDHRMSMMFTVAGHVATGGSVITNVDCESKSCPHFYDRLVSLLK